MSNLQQVLDFITLNVPHRNSQVEEESHVVRIEVVLNSAAVNIEHSPVNLDKSTARMS